MSGSVECGEPRLAIEGLTVAVPGRQRGDVEILRGVNLKAYPSRILGVVGETGSGKTMTARAVLGLLPRGSSVAGSIRYRDEMLEPGGLDRSHLLGRKFSMVFQDARSSLHPTMTIGRQVAWALKRAGVKGRENRREAARTLLQRVGLRGSDDELRSYPFQFSGGMCQRAAIGIALAPHPDLIIADEPTSALDPTIQLQIADLLADLVRESSLTLILITHDVRFVKYLCADVVVMKSGRVVEEGPVAQVLSEPQHEYTKLLLASSI
jgi:ABC-type dipeptide/oligopeptide/nickel transport system ATPase component